MNVAEIIVTVSILSSNAERVRIRFSDLAAATSEYDRIAALLRDRSNQNNIPIMIEIFGDGARATIPLDSIVMISLCDFAQADLQETGVCDAFPHLFRGA